MLFEVPKSVPVNNAATFTFDLINDSGEPYDMAGYKAVSFYVKATAATADGSAAVTDTSEINPVTVSSVVTGHVVVPVPSASLSAVGTFWYRLDVKDSNSLVHSFFCGELDVVAA